jgi:hypothetical protein
MRLFWGALLTYLTTQLALSGLKLRQLGIGTAVASKLTTEHMLLTL